MEIKLKMGVMATLCLSGFAHADIKQTLDVSSGFRTKAVALETYSGNRTGYDLQQFYWDNKVLFEALGASTAEFNQLTAGVQFSHEQYGVINPYVQVEVLRNHVKTGALLYTYLPLYNNKVSCTFGLDVYHAWSADVDLQGLHSELYSKFSFTIAESLNAYAEYRLPLLSTDLTAAINDDSLYSYDRQSSLSIGVSVALWPLSWDELISEEFVVQEPMELSSIYVSEVEEVDSQYDIDEMSDVPDYLDLMDAELVEEEAPLGWFAQLIEFLARLFRF
ncbi:hypothetical protein MMH89_02920 [Candidatus Comchoanobacter bicostacola]|uniref:Outer membrane protein n=1 Tax=Candidatus Comchoanobacter bicostacola TaxID=2919598 RepID=A0ABY5DJW0_9GAMM|nr:hypothetical protein [Candidatus Comchoanobacter bicostacola]UTC24174.1 hypothetical protein MMH89_02920 [Candidatus Comchoanobacter bicostacola]